MLRIASAMCTGMIAVIAWAAPALSSPPLMEPRPSPPPDSVRALKRAREDSLSALEPHRSGGASLAIGLATTLGPPAIALLANPPGSDNEWAWEGTLAAGIALGVLVGPALGLAVGGREDLARRGLLIRGLGYGATLLGLFALASSLDSSSSNDGGATVLALAGFVGAGVSVVSAAHDLAITPSAVDRGRGVSVRPVVDEHGRLALRATF
jgi:hypothetical protein